MSSKQVVFAIIMQWLMQIKENKEVLFGAFSDTLRKEDKVKQWKELASLAQSICLMPLEKDWTYARDTLWQNLKKSAVLKLDNAKKTGTGGMGKLSEIDKIVLDIIGKDSPIICGLGIPESMECTTSQSNTQANITLLESRDKISDTFHGDKSAETPNKTCKRKRITQVVEKGCEKEKKEKLKLQIEYLRHKTYKTKLEILKLEKELGLPSSEFTQSIPIVDNNDERFTYLNL